VVAKTALPKRKSLISRGGLARRMVLVILPLVLIPVLLMGAIAYMRSRALLKQQASDQLISTAQAQIQTIQEWTSAREQRLQLAAQRASLKQSLSELSGYDESDPGYEAAKENIRLELESLRTREGQFLFSDIVVASTVDDSVIVSTNPELEGGRLPALTEKRLSWQYSVHNERADAYHSRESDSRRGSRRGKRWGASGRIDGSLAGLLGAARRL
jgi:hypothetical protein